MIHFAQVVWYKLLKLGSVCAQRAGTAQHALQCALQGRCLLAASRSSAVVQRLWGVIRRHLRPVSGPSEGQLAAGWTAGVTRLK